MGTGTTQETRPHTSANTVTFVGRGCNPSKSGYLFNSPGTIDNLAACIQSCRNSAQCKSITFWPSKWCSHFSTTCENLVTLSGATAVRFQSTAETTLITTTTA